MTDLCQTFRERGYVAADLRVSELDLAMLRNVCDTLLDEPIDDGGGNRHKIGLGTRRRFLAHRHESFSELERFVMKGAPAMVAQGLIGTGCQLFNEQFVVKGAGSGASFAWHQDGAYVGFDHEPYLSVWIALDDTNAENGCMYLLPRNLDLEGSIDTHRWNEETRELSGYDGSEPGVAMTCAAGSMLAFSSLTLHRSGPNRTERVRRAYLVQYSAKPIRDPQTGALKRFAKDVATAPI